MCLDVCVIYAVFAYWNPPNFDYLLFLVSMYHLAIKVAEIAYFGIVKNSDKNIWIIGILFLSLPKIPTHHTNGINLTPSFE